MLDQIEPKIAHQLAMRHNYPFAENIYMNIFHKFSYFPIKLADLDIKARGETIILMALVIRECFRQPNMNHDKLYATILPILKAKVEPLFPQDITVETFLGTILFYYNPINIQNALSLLDPENLFDEKQRYEYELKKKTILLYAM